MDIWFLGYDVLDIVESIKQLENLGGGKILSIYIYTFSGASNLYGDRRTYVNVGLQLEGKLCSELN